MSNFIDFLLVISKLQSPIYCRSPQSSGFDPRSHYWVRTNIARSGTRPPPAGGLPGVISEAFARTF